VATSACVRRNVAQSRAIRLGVRIDADVVRRISTRRWSVSPRQLRRCLSTGEASTPSSTEVSSPSSKASRMSSELVASSGMMLPSESHVGDEFVAQFTGEGCRSRSDDVAAVSAAREEPAAFR